MARTNGRVNIATLIKHIQQCKEESVQAELGQTTYGHEVSFYINRTLDKLAEMADIDPNYIQEDENIGQ